MDSSMAQAKRYLSSPEEGCSRNKMEKLDVSPEMSETSHDNNDHCQCALTFESILSTLHENIAGIRSQNEKITSDIQDMKDLKEEINKLRQAVDFLSDKYDKQLEEISELKKENACLKNLNKLQESRIDDIDQYNRRQNILFDAVKETSAENTNEMVINQCKKLGVQLNPGDIQVSHRLGKKVDGKPRPIIARFTSVGTARSIIQLVKNQFRKANNDSNTKQKKRPEQTVMAREHLTDARAKLLQECLRLKREKKLSNCWIYNYEVYVKRSYQDKTGIKIQRVDQLNNF